MAGIFFTVLWALWLRMWLAAAALFVLFAASGVLVPQMGMGPVASFLLHGVFSLLLGLGGNELYRARLGRRGWREASRVRADNLAEAEIKFFANPGEVS